MLRASPSQGGQAGFVGARVLEAGTIVVCIVSLLSVVSLRKAGAGADALPTAQALVAFHDWVFLLGQGTIPAVNALLLGSLLYRSRLVPRVLPMLGFIGAPLLVASVTATLFDVWGQVSAMSALFTIPIAVWEFSLGVYLVVKGFRPSPITVGMTTAAHEDAAVGEVVGENPPAAWRAV